MGEMGRISADVQAIMNRIAEGLPIIRARLVVEVLGISDPYNLPVPCRLPPPPEARGEEPEEEDDDLPFTPSDFQISILKALKASAMTMDDLEAKFGDGQRSCIHKSGIKPLILAGFVQSRSKGGYVTTPKGEAFLESVLIRS